MHLRTVKAGDGALLKELTLRSVAEAPYAFGGTDTLEEERKRPDAEWDGLAAECGGDVEVWRDRCVGYFILDGEMACAKALAFLSFKNPKLAFMSGVWVDPRYRRRGLGRWLVTEACKWATGKGATRLRLWVDNTNPVGVQFYESLEFKPTGQCRPVSPGLRLSESSYERPLPAGA